MSRCTSATTPGAAALTGVPAGAAMSMPEWGRRGSPFRMRWLPNSPVIGPWSGQAKPAVNHGSALSRRRAPSISASCSRIFAAVAGSGVTVCGGRPSMRWVGNSRAPTASRRNASVPSG